MNKLKSNKGLGVVEIIVILVLLTLVIMSAISFSKKMKVTHGEYVETDELGYGQVGIGSPELYVLDQWELLDNSGYIDPQGHETGWEVTVVADSITQTEYLIFKDLETGNISAVERRKYRADF